jgi:hypothetical protein
MKFFMSKFAGVFLACVYFFPCAYAAAPLDPVVESVQKLVYSPLYFGPTAFPLPELRSGKVARKFEFEARGEFHSFSGDRTKDVFLRALLPIVPGRAVIEVSFVPWEHYRTTREEADRRHAIDVRNSGPAYSGDVVVSSTYRLLESDDWFDALLYLGLKSASGARLCDARFTDAATYWVGADVGRELAWNAAGTCWLRISAAGGFYCWMTNSLVQRQNDAFQYGAGLSSRLGNFYFGTDVSGFSGYLNNGDHPVILRNQLQYDLHDNVISLRYNIGLRDFLYRTFSVGLICRF